LRAPSWYLAVAVAVYFVGVSLRGLRWQRLIRPIQEIPVSQATSLLLIGYTANNVLPARMGDVMRVFLLGRETGIRKSALLATIVLERIMDVLAILAIILVCTVVLSWESPLVAPLRVISALVVWVLGLLAVMALQREGAPGTHTQASRGKVLALSLGAVAVVALTSGVLLGGVSLLADSWRMQVILLLVAVSFLPVMLTGSHGVPHWAQALLERTPGGLGLRLLGMVRSFLFGLQSLRSPGLVGQFIVLSLASWVMEGLMYAIVAYSFQVTQPIWVFLLLMGMVNIASAIPSSPGYIGTFEFVGVNLVLTQFGVSPEQAFAVVVLIHALLLVPVVMVGIVLIWRRRLRWFPSLEAEQVEGSVRTEVT